MLQRLVPAALLLTGMVVANPTGTALAQKSDSVVKVTATGTKPDSDGKQVITVTLKMDKGWHTYANPVGLDDLKPAQTTVSVTGKQKLEDVKVDYPPGKLEKDKVVGDYKVYDDQVQIKATVKRAKGDTGPLEVTVKLQACTSKKCLLPATVKLMVP